MSEEPKARRGGRLPDAHASDRPARARERDAVEKEHRGVIYAERVNQISGIMARQAWVAGESGPALAAEWGCSISVVEKAAAEASRRVVALSDPQQVRAIAAHYLAKAASEIDDIESEEPELKIKKGEALAKVMGPWARIAGVPTVVAAGAELALPEPIREAQAAAEAGDPRGLATVRAFAELEVQTVDAAARERARRLREDWLLLSDQARADVCKTLEGLR